MVEEKSLEEEIRERALAPPDELVDMRLLWAGASPKTPSQVRLAEMLAENRWKFREMADRAEERYRRMVNGLRSEGADNNQGVEEPEARDAGRERCDLAIQRLLEEAKEGL